MKIALICTEKLPVPPVAGGAVQLYIDGILPFLTDRYDITVFSIEHPALPAEELKSGVEYIRLPAATIDDYVNNIKQKLSTGSFDLVHVFNRPLWVLKLSEGLPGVRFSLSLHNEMFNRGKITADQAAECIKKVEFINTVSKFIADGVKKLYPSSADKLRVVYSGVNPSIYTPSWTDEGRAARQSLKEKYGLRSRKVVLFVGRLSEKKGVHVLLKAMAQVMERHPDTALVIIGSKWYGSNQNDDYSKTLKSLASRLKGPVVFTGFVPPAEIPQLFCLADVFVCPSQWEEPLARVHYEAMAAGLPIITTNRGGNAEVIYGNDNGRIINNYTSPEAFAGCISHYLENRQKALAAGRNGRKLAETRFNWQRVASEIFKPLEGSREGHK